MNAVVAQLTARSLLGRRRVLLLLMLPAVLLMLCTAARLMAGPDLEIAVDILSTFALGTVVPLLGLIAGAGSIGPEIDDGSIVYLMSKPVSRHSIVVSKLAVAIAVVAVVAALPTLLAGLLMGGTEEGLAVGYAIGAVSAGLAYCALFVLLAILTRNAVVVGLVYVLIWESLVGNFVPGAQVLSIQQWGLAITEKLVGSSAAGLGVSSAVSFGRGALLLVVLTLACTWYAGLRLRTLRLTGTE